jgi:hypothetical protein
MSEVGQAEAMCVLRQFNEPKDAMNLMDYLPLRSSWERLKRGLRPIASYKPQISLNMMGPDLQICA